LAGSVVKRQNKNEKWPKMAENGKKPKRRRDEAPISIDYTVYFVRYMVEKWHLILEETKRKMAILKRKAR